MHGTTLTQVQIQADIETTDDDADDNGLSAAAINFRKRRSRAGSMDKHLNSLKRIVRVNNAAMSLAIKVW